MAKISATIHVVTEHATVSGVAVKRDDIPSVELPYRIGKRINVAHKVGLSFVRALGLSSSGGVVAVTVSDGKRALASWRRMSLPGFTGTNDVHPLISGILKGESVGAWLNRRMSESEN
jgi:hypothetical protein